MTATFVGAYVDEGHITSDAGLLAVLLGSATGVVTLALLSRSVLSSPLTYEAKS
jgi:phospholipid N-methyltransferase